MFVMDRVELQIEVDAGLSIAQLAQRFGCSKGSVRYWLGKYGLTTHHRSGRASRPGVVAARAAGATEAVLECPTHGVTDFVLDAQSYYRCRACRSAAVAERRRRVKLALIAEFGGKCQLCGYDRYPGALAFHHVDPQTKAMTIAAGITLAIETLRAETRKCVLLCHNCHAEVEAGLRHVALH
jgi:transposase-like protein